MTAVKIERRTQAARRDEAEQGLLRAAVRLVAERGLERITLADVGEAAGYSRGLPTHYFGSKSGLIVALANRLVESFGHASEQARSEQRGLERLLATVGFYFEAARQEPIGVRALFVMLGDALNNPLITPQIAELNARSANAVELSLRAAIADGEVRADIDARAQSILILGALRGVVGQWLLAPEAIDLEAARDEFLASLKRSLAS